MLLTFLIPVYNDWTAAALLLYSLDQVCGENGLAARVTLVDDGSTDPVPADLSWLTFANLESVQILHLRRNLGSQRAIVVGLVDCALAGGFRDVVVWDRDSEIAAPDVLKLVEKARETRGGGIVFARPRAVFSLVPHELLKRVVFISEVWTHYTAGVRRAGLPCETTAGEAGGNMPFSLGAALVNGDQLAIRAGKVLTLLWMPVAAALAVLAFHNGGALTAALLLFTTLQAGAIVLLALSIVVLIRSQQHFLPIRDCPQYVMGRTLLTVQASVHPLALQLEAAPV